MEKIRASTSKADRPQPLYLNLSVYIVCSSIPLSARASPTPTPYELRPIYEAESPDELALVDAAYAYNVKLLKRTPGTAVVSLPGTYTHSDLVTCSQK